MDESTYLKEDNKQSVVIIYHNKLIKNIILCLLKV